eukprot:scaffold55_cov401-Prasinococcus_capsulatus_cf.AAC.11
MTDRTTGPAETGLGRLRRDETHVRPAQLGIPLVLHMHYPGHYMCMYCECSIERSVYWVCHTYCKRRLQGNMSTSKQWSLDGTTQLIAHPE